MTSQASGRFTPGADARVRRPRRSSAPGSAATARKPAYSSSSGALGSRSSSSEPPEQNTGRLGGEDDGARTVGEGGAYRCPEVLDSARDRNAFRRSGSASTTMPTPSSFTDCRTVAIS